MTDHPAWVQLLLKRESAGHWMASAFLSDLSRENVLELADQQPDGRETLRQAALTELTSESPEQVAVAILFLSVVGRHEDLAAVSTFLRHSSATVERAAKVCRFALQRAD